MTKILGVETGVVKNVDDEGFVHIDVDHDHHETMIHRQHCAYFPVIKGNHVRVIETDLGWHIEKIT